MGFKYPVLTPSKVEKILKQAGFSKKRQAGTSHSQWEGYTAGQRRVVTVDQLSSKKETYGPALVKSMIRQSGLDKKKFYSYLK